KVNVLSYLSALLTSSNDWGVTYTSTKICAVEGSTVDIHCSYTYPSRQDDLDIIVEKTLWFSNMLDNEPVDLRTDSKYSGRVKHLCDKNSCFLRITDLRQRDSAVYRFRFMTNHPGGRFTGSPGVNLTVTVSPQSEIMEGSSVTLTCNSDAQSAVNYTWYKKNQTLLNKEPQLVFSSIQSSDSGEYGDIYLYVILFIAIFTKLFLCTYCPSDRPNLPSVSVSPSEIVEGSSVTLTCSSDANPAANYTWYKENEWSPKASGQIFTITDIRAEHSGNYYCVVQDTTGHYNSTLHLIVVGGKFFTLLFTDTHVGFFYSSSKYLKRPKFKCCNKTSCGCLCQIYV
uniref:Ig-like domain-containing protein n=1 Tax=Anabas testudineus TaxID=64144 RepID=A0AAQ6IGR7_ANATE